MPLIYTGTDQYKDIPNAKAAWLRSNVKHKKYDEQKEGKNTNKTHHA